METNFPHNDRGNAAKLLRMAESTRDPVVANSLRMLASDYLKLAEQAEEKAAAVPQPAQEKSTNSD